MSLTVKVEIELPYFVKERKNTFQVVLKKVPLKNVFVSSFFLVNKYLISLHTSGGWEVAAGSS